MDPTYLGMLEIDIHKIKLEGTSNNDLIDLAVTLIVFDKLRFEETRYPTQISRLFQLRPFN